MENDPFAALRARLEEQLRADIELLHEAHRVKLRAFETVWRAQADVAAEPPARGAAVRAPRLTIPEVVSSPPPRMGGWSALNAIEEKMDELPEVFDKNDVIRAIGFTPKRATLFRAFDQLREEGWIANAESSSGRQPARFRKLPPPEPESD
jgi:hypothetical protein